MLYLLLFLVQLGFLTDVCQCCETGYYSSNGECQKCPNNCVSCGSASSCTLCHTGYYGETCSESCPVYCHKDICNQISGQCLTCKEGYYNDGNNSCSKCPENCATCNSKQFCFTCKSGYKDDNCQSICSSCKPGTSCDKNTGYCLSECFDGFSGELCDIPCDFKCKSCNKYKQQECISCASDRYGPSCNKQCPETCDLNTCDVINGSCTLGCIDGYWGETCEQTCSRQCNNQACYQSNGECMNGFIYVRNSNESSTKNSVSSSVIIGVIMCVVVVTGVSTTVLICIKIIRKRRFTGSNSSTSRKSSTWFKKCFESPMSRTVRKRKMKVHEDIEAPTQDISDEKSIERDAYTGIETHTLFEKNVVEKNNRSSMSETSHDKNETLSLITPKRENKDKENMESLMGFVEKTGAKVSTKVEKIKRTGVREPTKVEKIKISGDKELTLVEKKTLLTTLQNEKDEEVTQIKQRNDDTYSNRVSTKNIQKQDCVSNKDKYVNSNMNDERIFNTSQHGKYSTVSLIPVASSLKTKDVTNKFQTIGTDNESQGLTFNDTHLGNMNINDNETCYNIQVSRLAEYVVKKEKAFYHKEFLELSSTGMNFKNQGQDLASSDMNRLTINCARIGLPVVLEDDPSANINANFIAGGPFELKTYIAYMGPPVMSMSFKRAFWNTVLQERCGTIVMLTTEDVPEKTCTCIQRLSCSETYDDITVFCNGEQNHGSFTVRKYTIKKPMVERDVQRLLFTKWPPCAYMLPYDVSSFVNFLKYANKFNNHINGPTLVYCSSREERTGIYIALDILTKQGIDRGFVDIFGCVRRLGEQRLNILYNCEQYKFLHKALVIALASNPSEAEDESTV